LIHCSGDIGEQARPKHSKASLKLDRRTRIVHAVEVSETSCARKLRDRKPSLFNAFEIFDHRGTRGGQFHSHRETVRTQETHIVRG
jgi:hypothetical protein